MSDAPLWVTDTSVYTHLCRAGHIELLHQLAPGDIVLVPDDVDAEIQEGQNLYPDIMGIDTFEWAELTLLTEEEVGTQLMVKAALGGDPKEHLGECAVIACAQHRGLTALLDDRPAIVQADLRGVRNHDTLWLVIEAYTTLFAYDRDRAAKVVDDLLTTEMRLPIASGQSLLAWAYEEGLLPKEP